MRGNDHAGRIEQAVFGFRVASVNGQIAAFLVHGSSSLQRYISRDLAECAELIEEMGQKGSVLKEHFRQARRGLVEIGRDGIAGERL